MAAPAPSVRKAVSHSSSCARPHSTSLEDREQRSNRQARRRPAG